MDCAKAGITAIDDFNHIFFECPQLDVARQKIEAKIGAGKSTVDSITRHPETCVEHMRVVTDKRNRSSQDNEHAADACVEYQLASTGSLVGSDKTTLKDIIIPVISH